MFLLKAARHDDDDGGDAIMVLLNMMTVGSAFACMFDADTRERKKKNRSFSSLYAS